VVREYSGAHRQPHLLLLFTLCCSKLGAVALDSQETQGYSVISPWAGTTSQGNTQAHPQAFHPQAQRPTTGSTHRPATHRP
jgi:hypothetical protein